MNLAAPHRASRWLACSMLILAACGDDDEKRAGPVVSEERSAVIGADGGEIAVGGATLTIPAGALAAEETFIMRQHDGVTVEGWALVSPVYEIEPHGTTFATPATLTIPHGAANAQLLRADEMSAEFAPISADVGSLTTSAQLTGLSAYTVAEAALDNHRGGGGSFEVDGITYSPGPVNRGEVEGWGYSHEEAAGVSDGGPGNEPGRVWFGDDACATFRLNGTGLFDPLGGRNDKYSDVPHILISPSRDGGASPSRGTIPGTSLSMARMAAPDYDRTDELYAFRWGVRLDENGEVYEKDSGRLEFYVLFDEPDAPVDSQELHWRAGDGPFLNYFFLDDASTENDADHHFCYFAEKRVNEVDGDGLTCLERELYAGTDGEAVENACYNKGMIQGAYSLTTTGGQTLVSGEWKDNRPTGIWGFYDKDGNKKYGGEFDPSGVRFGKWEEYDDGRLERSCTLAGELVESPLGFHEVYDGPCEVYHTTTDRQQIFREGLYDDGFEDGEWLVYEQDGTLDEILEYDAAQKRALDTEFCGTTEEGEQACVQMMTSTLVRKTSYDWGECTPGNHTVWITEYDDDSQPTGQTCFELEGSRQEPQKGAQKECGGSCGL